MTSNANENADDEGERKAESHSGPDLAGAPHGELAADAAAYLERSGSSLEGFGGDPKEIGRSVPCRVGFGVFESDVNHGFQ